MQCEYRMIRQLNSQDQETGTTETSFILKKPVHVKVGTEEAKIKKLTRRTQDVVG